MPPGLPSRSRLAVAAALLALMLLMARVLVTRGDFISDDAWISMRYARNLIEGHGLLWNPGQPPVEGYSNLLWVLLCALGLGIGLSAPTVMLGLGLLTALLCVPAAYACVRAAGGSRATGLGAAALVSVSFLVAGTAMIGLEPPLLAVLMTAGTARLLWEEREIGEGRAPTPWSTLLFGLLSISHVEGPLYLAMPVLVRAFRPSAEGGIRGLLGSLSRRDALAAAMLLGPATAQELLRIFYYGDWMPNTVRVKASGASREFYAPGIRYVLFSLTLNPALGLFIGVGAAAVLRVRRGTSRFDRLAGRSLLIPWLLCAFFSIIANGDMLNQFRFMAPAAPTLLAMAALGWSRLFQWVNPAFRLAAVIVPLGFGAVAAQRDLGVQVVLHDRNPRGLHEGTFSGFLTVLGGSYGVVNEYARPLGRVLRPEPAMNMTDLPWFVMWVLENVPVGGTVLFPDVGVLGYALSDGNVLDARGLNSRGAAALVTTSPPDGPEGMQDPGVVAFLEEFRASDPEALALQYRSGKVWGPAEAALQGAGLLHRYTPIATGRYTSLNTGIAVFHAERARPTQEQVLERYRRMEREMPDIFDWTSRRVAIETGRASPAEGESPDLSEMQLIEPGAWYREMAAPPR